MPKYPFRILVESVTGEKFSYHTASFVDTDADLVLSSSQVFNRITGSFSASYQNRSVYKGSELDTDLNTSFTFKDNNLLSASLSGSNESGSIIFSSTDTDYNRLLRYKFFGEKVCNVLGLPAGEWIYVDQFRLPTDEESNYFEGNINAKNVFVRDDFTFAGTSNLASDLPIFVNTGSDRYIRFIDSRGIDSNAILIGYDDADDVYEISSSADHIFNIEGVNSYTGSDMKLTGTFQVATLSASADLDVKNITASGDIAIGGNTSNTPGSRGHIRLQAGPGTGFPDNPLVTIGLNSAGSLIFDSPDGIDNDIDTQFMVVETAFAGNSPALGINTTGNTAPKTLTVGGYISGSGDLFLEGGITSSGDISSSGKIVAEKYVLGDNQADVITRATSPSRVQIGNGTEEVTLLGDGVGFLHISRSNIGIGTTEPKQKLEVIGNISASGAIIANSMEVTHLTSSFVTSSTILSEGSNTFGDDPDDKHEFTGSTHMSGSLNISNKGGSTELLLEGQSAFSRDGVSLMSVGSVLNGIQMFGGESVSKFSAIKFDEEGITISSENAMLTSSVNISSSGFISASTFIGDGAKLTNVTATATVPNGTISSSTQVFTAITSSGDISASGNLFSDSASFGTSVTSGEVLTIEGNISASGELIASSANFNEGNITNVESINVDFINADAQTDNKIRMESTAIKLAIDDNDVLNIEDGRSTFTGPITASGDISASGHIYGSAISSSAKVHGTSFVFSEGTNNITRINREAPAKYLFTAKNSTTAGLIISGGQAGGNPKAVLDTTHAVMHFQVAKTDVQLIKANEILFKQPATFESNVSASGDISSSLAGTLSIGTGSIFNDLTVGGNISASGNLFAHSASFGTSVTSGEVLTIEGGISASGNMTSDTLTIAKSSLTGSILPLHGTFNINYGTATQFSSSLSNAEGYGEIISHMTVHASCGAGDICYSADNIWRQADADAAASAGDVMLGVGLSGPTGGPGPILIRGMVRLGAGHITDSSGQNGDSLYLSTTAGHVQFAAPSGNNDIARIVGYCMDEDSDIIYFNPSATFVEVSA